MTPRLVTARLVIAFLGKDKLKALADIPMEPEKSAPAEDGKKKRRKKGGTSDENGTGKSKRGRKNTDAGGGEAKKGKKKKRETLKTIS